MAPCTTTGEHAVSSQLVYCMVDKAMGLSEVCHVAVSCLEVVNKVLYEVPNTAASCQGASLKQQARALHAVTTGQLCRSLTYMVAAIPSLLCCTNACQAVELCEHSGARCAEQAAYHSMIAALSRLLCSSNACQAVALCKHSRARCARPAPYGTSSTPPQLLSPLDDALLCNIHAVCRLQWHKLDTTPTAVVLGEMCM